MEWIAEVDRIDRMLHSAGVPASERMKAVAQIMDALAHADKQRRTRKQLATEAVNQCHGNVRQAAKQEGWSRATIYRALQPVAKPPVDETTDRAA